MSINATLFIQAIVFAILVWFTMKFVWPPIVGALDERAKKISDGLEAAEKAKFELHSATRHAEQEMAKTKDLAAAHFAEAEKRAHPIIEEAKSQAVVEAQRIIAQARAEAEQQVVQARESLRLQVAQLALKGAEQILQKEVNANVHAQLLEQLQAQL